MLQDKIKSLINIIEDTEINELEVSSFWGAQKIRLQKNINIANQITAKPTVVTGAATTAAVDEATKSELLSLNIEPQSDPEPVTEVAPSNTVEIIAPLVGTFYQSAKPGAPAFVKEGDTIEVGQIICIIEAMKIFNEIEAEISGKVKKVIINDSAPVEYGQPLMLVESS